MFLVVFRNRKRADIDDAAYQADEAAAKAWGRHAEHVAIQGRGRQVYYQDYTLFACGSPRIHTFARSKS